MAWTNQVRTALLGIVFMNIVWPFDAKSRFGPLLPDHTSSACRNRTKR